MTRWILPLASVAASVFLTANLMVFAAADSIPADWQPVFDQGVQAYRDGNYAKAHKVFKLVTEEVPKSPEGHYYLAISLAQLGRFKDAKAEYQEVIKMAPDSEAAKLAGKGISYLPDDKALDTPPVFQKPEKAADKPAESNAAAPQAGTAPAAANPTGGMDPQAIQMMMLMSSFSGGGGGGFNPMMLPLMETMMKPAGAGNEPGAASPAMSPDMIKSMMMNQMMQDFNPFGGKDD